MAIVHSWANQGGHDSGLNNIMKEIFQFVCGNNISLTIKFMSSSSNPADAPSRAIRLTDSMLHSAV